MIILHFTNLISYKKEENHFHHGWVCLFLVVIYSVYSRPLVWSLLFCLLFLCHPFIFFLMVKKYGTPHICSYGGIRQTEKKRCFHHFSHSRFPSDHFTTFEDDVDKVAIQTHPCHGQKIESGPLCYECSHFDICSGRPHSKCTCHAKKIFYKNCMQVLRCLYRPSLAELRTS